MTGTSMNKVREQLKLAEEGIEVKTPDVCAVCGLPSTGRRQVRAPNKQRGQHQILGVWAKLCEACAAKLTAPKKQGRSTSVRSKAGDEGYE